MVGTILAILMVLIAIFLYKGATSVDFIQSSFHHLYIISAWFRDLVLSATGKVGEIEPGIGIISGLFGNYYDMVGIEL
ncbi:MAG: hypothetical protein IPL98_18905 [Saprospiraceae bacterium]|nr:hypothetical protein [Saprospiraceae bacterium]